MPTGTFGEGWPVSEKDRAKARVESLLQEATKKRDSLQREIDYYKNLPRRLPPTGGPKGDGGGDLQDWNVEVGSHKEEQDQRDYYLSDDVEEEIRRLDDRIYELGKDLEAIMANDEAVIGNHLV